MNSTRASLALFALLAASACTSGTTTVGATAGDGSSTDGSAGSDSTGGSGASSGTDVGSGAGSTGTTGQLLGSCRSCFDDTNCQSGLCIQLGSADSFCLPSCASAACSGSDTCQSVTDVAGNPQPTCIPQSGACGDVASGACQPAGCADPSSCDVASGSCVTPTTTTGSGSVGSTGTAGSTGSTGACGSDVPPSTPAACSSCSPGPSCQANGCYGGWYCDTIAVACVSPQNACGGSVSTGTSTSSTTTAGSTAGSTTGTGTTTGGSTGNGSAGSPWTGSVTHTGGSVDRLYFTALGDCRPPSEDQTSQYPTAIANKIFQDMNALAVKPQFVVATGDYMYASPSGSQGATQIQYFLSAKSAGFGTSSAFDPPVLFPAMGNHECTGATDSNCSSSSTSHNFADFMTAMMTPLGQSKPYYRYDVNDTNGQWTAKFIVLAMNSWDTGNVQANWLTAQLQQTTTYTFIIRHEPDDANTAPGVTPSDAIINQYPFTLKIVGHSHEFYHQGGSREIVVGNGGAPLAPSGPSFGYALIQMLADGNIQVDDYEYQSNAPVRTLVIPK